MGTPDGPTVLAAGIGGPGPVSVVSLVRVLLLNASHEPLAVVTGRRALVLVVAGKAECVVERADSIAGPLAVAGPFGAVGRAAPAVCPGAVPELRPR